ncbi:phosphate signaling complex protein PhoU [Peribacillus sp. B-H-3]|jgi:phosphate transport system protein|uniref:phosphate signaling complex protein PhoU n=1 Tax=Bacillaceae TaxID=186817 RepID=UPI0008F5D502|nr:phosphate signaling complex protein PhoU [Bacillus sp. MUM 13]OIK12231.1 phosphate transport system regulatory protein PhoU [Bacillus sp. MUM 13]
MVVREKFELELKELKSKLIQLSEYASLAISKSFAALENQDLELAVEIIEEDTRADMLEEEINDFAILLIAKQQPVAIDLRRIVAAIKIASDIERIADFGVNIAKSAIRIGEKPFIVPLTHFKNMHSIALEMIELSMKAFEEDDIVLARQIALMDDEVDRLYGESIKSLLQLSNENLQQVTQLSFVARYLERTADHTTNIAENIYYLVRGRHLDLNE